MSLPVDSDETNTEEGCESASVDEESGYIAHHLRDKYQLQVPL